MTTSRSNRGACLSEAPREDGVSSMPLQDMPNLWISLVRPALRAESPWPARGGQLPRLGDQQGRLSCVSLSTQPSGDCPNAVAWRVTK